MPPATLRQSAPGAPQFLPCRLCGCKLGADREPKSLALGVCDECADRREARRLGPAPETPGDRASARAFTAAERALIANVCGQLPAVQLLALLNERLACDLGPDAAPYTMEQLHEQIRQQPAPPFEPGDWAALRTVLAGAKRSGLLHRINAQTIDDFAVVYALAPAQALHLKEILLAPGGSR